MNTRQILFIQGGGKGVHDEWDNKLFDDLSRELGDGHEVHYPRMPAEDDPSYARWSAAIRREMAALNDGAVVAGHSVRAAGPATSSSYPATSARGCREGCGCKSSMDAMT